MRRLLHRPSVWYGLLSCLLLTTVSLILHVLQQTPLVSGQSGLSIQAPQLEWQPMLILLGTAAAVAWHTGRIRVAVGVALSALIGSWLLTWALLILPTAVGMPVLLSLPLVQHTQSITVEQALLVLLIVSSPLALIGVVVATCGALLAYVCSL